SSFLLLSFSIILPYLIVDLKLCNRTPEYYQMGNIDQKVLKPAMKELHNYFENLEVTKIKAKKGNKIAKLEFTFTGLKTNKPSVTMHDWVNGE
ncbi:replication initiation protein, partial [Enterococcus faecalis]|uniref:replication initiation protein n=1 Tax=Enterococcus faecalis TaxID=1351 RepID=UPI001FF0C381